MFAFVYFRHLNITKDSTEWSIVNTVGIDAEILWQKQIPCISSGYTTPHGALAISGQQVIFHQACYGLDGSLIAVDLYSGNRIWNLPLNGVFQVVPLKNDYLIVYADSIVRRLNQRGETIWETDRFASRSMRAVFPYVDLIYAPFRMSNGEGIHIIQEETGEIIQTLENQNIIALYNDLAVQTTDGALEVVSVESESILWSISIPIAHPIPSFSDIIRVENTLVIYTAGRQLDAYNIHSGQKLWTIQQNFGSYPFFLQNRIYIYGLDNQLHIFDVESGQVFATIAFTRTDDSQPDLGRPESNVAIAGYDNIVALNFRNTNEMLTMQLEELIQ